MEEAQEDKRIGDTQRMEITLLGVDIICIWHTLGIIVSSKFLGIGNSYGIWKYLRKSNRSFGGLAEGAYQLESNFNQAVYSILQGVFFVLQ